MSLSEVRSLQIAFWSQHAREGLRLELFRDRCQQYFPSSFLYICVAVGGELGLESTVASVAGTTELSQPTVKEEGRNWPNQGQLETWHSPSVLEMPRF